MLADLLAIASAMARSAAVREEEGRDCRERRGGEEARRREGDMGKRGEGVRRRGGWLQLAVGGDCLQGNARLTSSFREVEHGGDGGGGGGGRGFRGLLLEENGANGFACKHVLQNVKDQDGGG